MIILQRTGLLTPGFTPESLLGSLLMCVLAILLVMAPVGQTVAAEADPEELVLLVNPESGIKSLSRTEVVNLYMGRFRQLPSGTTALPVDLIDARAEFYQLLVNKTLAEINSYWARLVFSGRASPPRQAQDVAEVLDIVANNKGAIGYLRRRDINDSVRVAASLSAWAAEHTAQVSP